MDDAIRSAHAVRQALPHNRRRTGCWLHQAGERSSAANAPQILSAVDPAAVSPERGTFAPWIPPSGLEKTVVIARLPSIPTTNRCDRHHLSSTWLCRFERRARTRQPHSHQQCAHAACRRRHARCLAAAPPIAATAGLIKLLFNSRFYVLFCRYRPPARTRACDPQQPAATSSTLARFSARASLPPHLKTRFACRRTRRPRESASVRRHR